MPITQSDHLFPRITSDAGPATDPSAQDAPVLPDPTSEPAAATPPTAQRSATSALMNVRERLRDRAEHSALLRAAHAPSTVKLAYLAADDVLARLERGERIDLRPGVNTDLSAFELERRLVTLDRGARLHASQHNCHSLYLTIGALAWGPEGKEFGAYAAPLILYPVTLHRGWPNEGNGTFTYALAGAGEPARLNPLLEDAWDIGPRVQLPPLPAPSMPMAYLDSVQELLQDTEQGAPDVTVQTHMMVTLLPVDWLAMYRDVVLTPSLPTNAVEQHPRVRALLGDALETSDTPTTTPADVTDALLASTPLVAEAEGTRQREAERAVLADVAAGRDMTVGAPNGAERARVLANIVAAILERGRTALVVSNTPASLEGLHRHLADAGLDDFALPAYGRHASLRAFSPTLARRLTRRGKYSPCPEYAERVQRLRDIQAQMVEPKQHDHPWAGVMLQVDEFLDERALIATLETVVTRAIELASALNTLSRATQWPLTPSVDSVDRLIALLEHVPDFDEEVVLDALLPKLHNPTVRDRVVALTQPRPARVDVRAALAERCHPTPVPGADTVPGAQRALGRLRDRAPHTGTLREAKVVAAERDTRAQAIEQKRAEIEAILATMQRTDAVTLDVVHQLTALAPLLASAPIDALPFRHDGLLAPDIREQIETVQQDVAALHTLRERLEQRLDLTTLPTLSEVRRSIAALGSAGMLGFLDKTVTSARKMHKGMLHEWLKANDTDALHDCQTLATYIERQQRFNAQPVVQQVAGPFANGASTPFNAFTRLVEWYASLRDSLPHDDMITGGMLTALWNAPIEWFAAWQSVQIPTEDEFDNPFAPPASTGHIATLQRLESLLQEAEGTVIGLTITQSSPIAEVCDTLRTDATTLRADIDAIAALGFDETTEWNVLDDILRDVARLHTDGEDDTVAFEQELLRSHIDGLDVTPEQASGTLAAYDAVASADLPEPIRAWIMAGDITARVTHLHRLRTQLAAQREAYRQTAVAFERLANIDYGIWFGDTGTNFMLTPLPDVVRRAERAIAEPRRLREWLEQAHRKNSDDAAARLDTLVREARLLRQHALAYQLSTRPVPAGLATSDDTADAGTSEHPATDLALLAKIADGERGERVLRDVVTDAGAALQGLYPCVLMGPGNVARHLPMGQMHFDYVIIEGATHMLLDDAIGCIARGDRVIAVTETPRETTRHHDETLADAAQVAFDAHHTIHTELSRAAVTVADAASHPQHEPHPLDAVFAAASDEDALRAERAADAVMTQLRRAPDASVGVIVFTTVQQQHVADAVDRRIKADPFVQFFFDRRGEEAEPFFVSRVDEARGEMRDAIIVALPDTSAHASYALDTRVTAAATHARSRVCVVPVA